MLQETDVAVKALAGLEELKRIVRMVPEALRSNPEALQSWLVNSDTEAGSASMIRSLEREVTAHCWSPLKVTVLRRYACV